LHFWPLPISVSEKKEGSRIQGAKESSEEKQRSRFKGSRIRVKKAKRQGLHYLELLNKTGFHAPIFSLTLQKKLTAAHKPDFAISFCRPPLNITMKRKRPGG